MQKNKERNILVVRISAMGDVAMVSSVLEQFCLQNPNIHVTMVTNCFYKPFFDNIKGVSVFSVDVKNQHKGILGIIRMGLSIMLGTKFDTVIDLHDVIRSKILSSLYKMSGKKIVIIDKGRNTKEKLTQYPNKEFYKLDTTITRYVDCFHRAGFPLEMPSKPERKIIPLNSHVKNILHINNKEGKWYGVAPFAQHQGKIYPIHLMEQVIKELCSNESNTVFLFGGGAQERAVTEYISAKYKNCISIISRISLKEELSLISNLDCMISMDSSAMHMASLMGVRVISIWGATHYYAGFLGYGQSTDDIVEIDLDCRPCSIYGNKPCLKYSYECMNAISPSLILEKIKTT